MKRKPTDPKPKTREEDTTMKITSSVLALALLTGSVTLAISADMPASQTNPAINPNATTNPAPAEQMPAAGQMAPAEMPMQNLQGTVESIDRKTNRISVKDQTGKVVEYSLNDKT